MALALDPDVGVSVASDAVERAQRAGAGVSKAVHGYSERFEVNFETDGVSLVRSTVDDGLSITVYLDGRKGSAEVTGRDHDGVDAAVEQALTAARASEPDPANVLPDAPAEPATTGGDQHPDRDAMVDAVARFIAHLRRDHPAILTRSSSYSFVNSWSSYANSFGRTQHARRSNYGVAFVLAGRDERASTSFQYTSTASAEPVADIGALPAVRQATDETARSFGARPIPETFVGDVILTPQALGSFLASVIGAMSGLALMKRTTPFLDRLGQRIAPESFSLLHRPSVLAAAPAFDDEGFPNADLDVVRGGVLENFVVGWYMSHKLGRPMTTALTNPVVNTGDTAVDEIIASTDRGIMMGRYSGGIPNQNLDFSGVAKNSFYVERGKVVGPISETMVAGNLVALLSEIAAISREEIDYGFFRMPWVAAGGVTISTK